MQKPIRPPAAALPEVSPLAEELAVMPGVVDLLLDAHVQDGAGYCRGCRLPQAGHMKWPCSLVAYARQARRFQLTTQALRTAREAHAQIGPSPRVPNSSPGAQWERT